MADVKWIKICTDIFDDEKILLIEALPERDSIIVIWFKLLCMAGKQNNSGVFMLNKRIAYTEEMLATIFRRPLNTVRLAIKTFEEYGMVEIINDAITIPNWNKHQNLESIQARREYMQKYMKEYRKKQAQIACNDEAESVEDEETERKHLRKCHVSAPDKEEEKEIEEEQERKKARKKAASGYDVALAEYTSNEDLKQALLEFIKMRKLMKKPLTDRALRLILSKLDELATTDADKIEILNQSITHNWLGVFPLKQDSSRPQQQKQTAPESDPFWDMVEGVR